MGLDGDLHFDITVEAPEMFHGTGCSSSGPRGLRTAFLVVGTLKTGRSPPGVVSKSTRGVGEPRQRS